MMNWKRTLAAALTVGALLVGLVATTVPERTEAANLTGGQTTYVINGEEFTFPFDPVSTKAGLLLPTEVFQRLGIKIEGATGLTVSLTRADVAAVVTVGSSTARLNAQVKSLAAQPLRLNGRLFLPADLLPAFGVEFSQDGNFVMLRTLVDQMPLAKEYTDYNEWIRMTSGRMFATNVKSDQGNYMSSEWTLLNSDLVNSKNIGFDYGTRARLNSLLPANTLVMVKLSNTSNKSGGLVTTQTYLIDDLRNQYQTTMVFDAGTGLLDGKLAPGADRMGVLVFPKVKDQASIYTIYYEPNGEFLGSFVQVK
jgi:hypothetical protein